MDGSPRINLRLRRGALRSLELALFALLLAMAAAVAWPSSADGAADDDPLQCGNSQSSPAVMNR